MTPKTLLPALAVLCTLHMPNTSQAASPERCKAYADAQVALAVRADAKACPAIKRRAKNWDTHFNWCLGKSVARIDDEESTWDAKFDGCMSDIEAAKTEQALAEADRRARIDGAIGSYDERWRKGVQRMADIGMRRPFHPKGYEYEAVSKEPKVWGAGLERDQQIGYYGVCDTCKGITARLKDAKGRVVVEQRSDTNAIELMGFPTTAGNGSIEFTLTNCQTRDDSCKMRFTSFAP